MSDISKQTQAPAQAESATKAAEISIGNNNARELNFTCQNLGRDVYLLLTFTPPPDGELYVDEFPLCWKVIHLPATGTDGATVVYSANTAFMVPQVTAGDLVTAANGQSCSTGQQCTVVTVDSANVITTAAPGVAGFLECVNDTAAVADIGFGFYDSTGTIITPALMWTKVPVLNMVKAQFTPTLRIYATQEYQETQVIRGAIQSPLLWKQNLEELSPSSYFSVTIDPNTGDIQISNSLPPLSPETIDRIRNMELAMNPYYRRGVHVSDDLIPAPSANVSASQLISFLPGVTAQQAADVDNSCLYAQLAASMMYNQHTQPKDWYNTYTSYLKLQGWTSEDFSFVKVDAAQSLGSVDKTVLTVLAPAFDGPEYNLLLDTFTALSNYGPTEKPAEVFNGFSTLGNNASFAMHVASSGSDGNVNMTAAVFFFDTTKPVSDVLRYSWGTNKVNFYAGIQKCVLNEQTYSEHRDIILNFLAQQANLANAALQICECFYLTNWYQ